MSKKYVIYRCRFCGTVTYMRNDQKGSNCRFCGRRNELSNKLLILQETDDPNEAVAFVQMAKFKRKTYRVKTNIRRLTI